MMKYALRFCLMLLVCFFAVGSVQAKGKKKNEVYAFAFGTNFNDSIVYLSAIEVIPDAELDRKTQFLNNRNTYSNRLKFFLDRKYNGAHTCAVFFGRKKEALEKTYVQLRRNYNRDKHATLVEIPLTDFQISVPADTNKP